MLARLLLAIPSPHVDGTEDHDWFVGLFDRAVHGAGAALTAQCRPMKHKWFRDGVTTVEVVPTMTKHNGGHVAKTHYDDFNAARSQQAHQKSSTCALRWHV